MYMNIAEFFNNPKNKIKPMEVSESSLSSLFNKSKPVIPPVIPVEHHQLFTDEAKKINFTPEEFGTIANREQGFGTVTPKLIGSVDKTDRGVMQVNKINEPLIQGRFLKEIGRPYNPNLAADSIIAARMVLEENRRQFETHNKLKQYTLPISNQDLIDSYNTGVAGFIKAKQGDPKRKERLLRYQNAGK
jgi:hypothetical protein